MIWRLRTAVFHYIVVGAVFIAAGLITIGVASAQQPNPQQGPLWNLARKACTGELVPKADLSKAMKLEEPVYYYRERKPVEMLVISVRHCPEPLGDVTFVVGHVFGGQGKGLYYKISTLGDGIIQAAQSYYDAKLDDVIYQLINPISQVGGRNVYPQNIQDDYTATMAVVIAKWRR